MKPGVTHSGDFEITNVGKNGMMIYKRLLNYDQSGGILSEPECVEGGGVATNDGNGLFTCSSSYVERCNIAAYTLYGMTVQINGGTVVTIVDQADQVRLDNIEGVWIELGELPVDGTMFVTQTYVLSSWDGATDPTVTNWAQGDVMIFNVELYGEQLTGTGPVTGLNPTITQETVNLVSKDGTTWAIVPGATGTLTYDIAGPEFVYTVTGAGLTPNTVYDLIYYADDYPGNNPGAFIGSDMTDSSGYIGFSNSEDLNMDLPHVDDQNYPAGAKIWLVPASDYDETTGAMTTWNPDAYLFDESFIQYDDTDV
jgi:hypothetical protein